MSENHPIILVEWADATGRQPVNRIDALGDGAKALESAMDTIREVAERIAGTMNILAGNPQLRELKKVEVEFGLKLDVEAGAIIAKTSVGANINVTMTWEK